MIQNTSRQAYQSIKPTLGRRQAEVLAKFKIYGDMTNEEMSANLNIPINQVTPRVLELRKMGVIERKCTKVAQSGRESIVWGIVTEEKQMRLF